jgi:histidinol dehydrogenase
MKIVKGKTPEFEKTLSRILQRTVAEDVEGATRAIIASVKKEGDSAVRRHSKRFDGVEGGFLVTKGEIKIALRKIPSKDLALLRLAAGRIRSYHKKQVHRPWLSTKGGVTLGQKATPLGRVGIYVPGGKAAYPSTVLMNAIPAKVAGVGEIIMATPPGKDGINPYILAAAAVAGVDSVYAAGGAQAIAALGFGTETIPKVDKIAGPGNIYVATAKRLLFGTVGIDMIAGPSEVLIINDSTGDPSWLASDLLSQAEHDELSSAILITTSLKIAMAVKKEVARRLKNIERRKIAEKSLKNRSAIFVVKTLDAAVGLANEIAPEHLELFVERPRALVKKIKNAGAIFLGPFTPEPAGDYLAGPSHTLPTGGGAKFSSPLGVYDFMKFSSIVEFSKGALKKFGPSIVRFSEIEGLKAHGESIKVRAAGR